MLSILMTNLCLALRSGTEVMTRELAVVLRERGHRVAVYTPTPGPLAQEVMALGVPVTDRIDRLGFTPDVIHGHHNTALAPALVRFPDTPALFVCHDTSAPYDRAIVLDRVRAYVGIDQACCERLLADGAPFDRISLVPNGVDLRRFRRRKSWSAMPRRALAVTKANAPYLDALRAACDAAGIALDVVGPAVGRTVHDLPRLMLDADIVFATARSAMEAAATGAAVVICDEYGFHGLLRLSDTRDWPDTPLGRRTLREVPTAPAIAEALAAYDAAEAEAVSQVVRTHLSLDICADAFERLYAEATGGPPVRQAPADHAALAQVIADAIPGFGDPPALDALADAQRRRTEDAGHWFALNAPALARTPAEVSFSRNGAGRLLLGDGWSEPESWGVWSEAARADLVRPAALLAAWRGDLTFCCCHWFPAAADDTQTREVDVLAGGRHVTTWRFVRRDDAQLNFGWRRLALPPGGRDVALRFVLRDADSPLLLGESTDRRRLGIALQRLVPTASLLG